MKPQKELSILRMAAVFDCDRLTLYRWLSRGCPVMRWPAHGQPAELSFPAVLKWRWQELLANSWEEETVDEMVAHVKARYRVMMKAWRAR
jgi:phage terminase Nu1 subunit (DNA packaging protein)